MKAYARFIKGGSSLPPPAIQYMSRIFNTTGGSRSLAVTPAVGDLLLVMCQATGTITFTVADNQGGTYSNITGAYKGSSADGMVLFARDQAVASAVSHTITMTVSSTSGSGMAVWRVTNMTNFGASCLRTNGSQINQSTSAVPAPVLGGAALGTAPVITWCYQSSTGTVLAPAGYTQHFDESYLTPSTAWTVASKDSGEVGQTITWQQFTSAAWSAAVVELKTPS